MCLLYRSFIVIFMQVLTITCLMRWLRVFEVALLEGGSARLQPAITSVA